MILTEQDPFSQQTLAGCGQDRVIDVVVLDLDAALPAPCHPDPTGDRLRDRHAPFPD
ncbi:hypothetical protein ACFY7H_23980 [Streptomyces sp. NPDC012794]|uniref:hypothetical protein n=1 Tax=Streptomyces sp. NPDC012794 TaxID=3364850 RepID=UPI003689D24C